MIAPKRIEVEKARVVRECPSCGGASCQACLKYCWFIDKMAETGVPVDYWFREMRGFYGDQRFKEAVLRYAGSLEDEYVGGGVLCLVGHRGTGKTMAACGILKAAMLDKYTTHYTTLVEAVGLLTSREAHVYRRSLKMWDFVVIDEVDQRYFETPASRSLYGNQFENILRARAQNRLPLVFCTNSEDIGQIFDGEFGESFSSLGSQFFRVLRAGGKDARKGEEKHGS